VSAKNDSRVCPQCGGIKTNYYAQQCRSCWLAQRKQPRRCVDCNAELRSGSGAERKRCRACYKIYRQTLVQTCVREGCQRPTYAKGLCQSHYQVGWRQANPGHKAFDYAAHKMIRESPCALCGYSRMNSEVHRIVPKGPYTIGNMVPVCSRCHDEIERGLTPCPAAWQLPERKAAPQIMIHKAPGRYGGTCQRCGRTNIRTPSKVCRPCYEVRKAAARAVQD